MKSYKIVIHCDGIFQQGMACDMAIEGIGLLKQAEDEVGRALYSDGWKIVQRFQQPNAHYCPDCAPTVT